MDAQTKVYMKTVVRDLIPHLISYKCPMNFSTDSKIQLRKGGRIQRPQNFQSFFFFSFFDSQNFQSKMAQNL